MYAQELDRLKANLKDFSDEQHEVAEQESTTKGIKGKSPLVSKNIFSAGHSVSSVTTTTMKVQESSEDNHDSSSTPVNRM